MKLIISALIKYIIGVCAVGALLFLPAWTLSYPNGWLFMGLLFIPMFFLGGILLLRAPELLEKRLGSKEKESEQKKVVGLAGLLFLASFVLSGLDYRLGCTEVPLWLTVTASVVLLLSYGMYAEVMRENAYLSRTVEVQEGQKVIDTGLYGIIRHPMYSATLLLFLSMPLILGSLYSFAISTFLPTPIAYSR